MNTATKPLLYLEKEHFIKSLQDIYEHSQWVAEALFLQKESLKADTTPLHDLIQNTMQHIVNAASDETKLALLQAHPDLAGKAALAGELTHASTNEQAGAGLDQCSEQELTEFTKLNDQYRAKFGFPFIMAVKGATKEQILAGFRSRLPNDRDTEFERALAEVHKIAGFRLNEFPDHFWQR